MTYLEDLRNEHRVSGNCPFCGIYCSPLERHHELYKPERTINLCHNCHFKVTFQSWLLTDEQKRRLLNVRFAGHREITQSMIDNYKAPGWANKEQPI